MKKFFKKVKKTVDKLKRLCYTIVRKNKGDTKMKWYRFEWADGTISYAAGYSKVEMSHMVRNHGKLLSKTRA